jgi:hypothetical protein
MTKTIKRSAEVEKIVDFMKANAGKTLTWAEICKGAGVDCKTGYITGVKSVLGVDNLDFGETEVQVMTKRTVKTYTYKG